MCVYLVILIFNEIRLNRYSSTSPAFKTGSVPLNYQIRIYEVSSSCKTKTFLSLSLSLSLFLNHLLLLLGEKIISNMTSLSKLPSQVGL